MDNPAFRFSAIFLWKTSSFSQVPCGEILLATQGDFPVFHIGFPYYCYYCKKIYLFYNISIYLEEKERSYAIHL